MNYAKLRYKSFLPLKSRSRLLFTLVHCMTGAWKFNRFSILLRMYCCVRSARLHECARRLSTKTQKGIGDVLLLTSVVGTIIHARWIIPVVPENVFLDHHSVAIGGDGALVLILLTVQGKIVDILPTELANKRYDADTVIFRPTHALIPGLINSHNHAPMALFRGFADDLPLAKWLNDHIFPAESKWVSPSFVR